MSPHQSELYQKIDEVLFYDWDPIGVSAMADWPRDEYGSYVHKVYLLALNSDLPEPIAGYLGEVTEYIGLPIDSSPDIRVAKKVLSLEQQYELS